MSTPHTSEPQALRRSMRACEQIPGLSVLAHGQSVLAHYRVLIQHLCASPQTPLSGWRYPSWLIEHGSQLLAAQIPSGRAARYQIYHDCGKPATLVRDELGRAHFPGHAQASAEIFAQHFPDRRLEQGLIREDMRIHTMAASDLEETLSLSEEGMLLWPTLLLTALCEVHANAAMFGGIESTSFKAKFKHIERRGKALCRSLTPTPSIPTL